MQWFYHGANNYITIRLTYFSILQFFYDLLRIFEVSVNMILPLKSIGKNLQKKFIIKTCRIMDALHRSICEDFRSTCFSNLRFFHDLLCNFEVSANLFGKRDIYNQRWTAG
jgi:hypothetical protein